MCRYGHGVVRGIFEEFETESLRGFVVFLPMLEGDDEDAAKKQSSTLEGERVAQVWDSLRQMGDLVAESLALTKTAWDIYLLFPPEANWEKEVPPPPAFWMHQLSPDYGIGDAPALDPEMLSQEIKKHLEKILPSDSGLPTGI